MTRLVSLSCVVYCIYHRVIMTVKDAKIVLNVLKSLLNLRITLLILRYFRWYLDEFLRL